MATKQPPPSASTSGAAVSMKDYLKRYQSGPAAADQKKAKKKKKTKPSAPAGAGVLIVDEDPVWQKPVQIEDDEPASSGDEKPQVNEDIEVKRMRRMEEIRAKRPYNSIANDGSGWVTVDADSPRRRRNDTPSPERGAGAGAGRKDLSPPRQRQRRDTPSPKHGSAAGADISPPRQRQRRRDTPSPEAEGGDLSPPRKSRQQGDQSPPRRRARHDSEEPQDLSPPRRRTRHDSEEPRDLSPPRRRTRHDSVDRKDLSPPRRQPRQGTKEPEDISPPRRRKGQDSTQLADLSPPRKRKMGQGLVDGDISPPRKGQKFASDDLSPPRKGRDLSPPRKGRKEGAPKEARRAGLMSAEEVKEDIRKIKEDEKLKFAAQDPSFTGKGAKAVFRDKEGKRINQEDIQKAKGDEKPKEKHIEWGKGLVQKRAAEARVQDLEDEKSKPFARTRDDPELDSMLKNRLRWGDPMAHLVKRKEDFLLDDLGDDEKMKESGFIVPQNVPTHSWLKRGVDPPLNRYGIKPGRHWDGVDRSNGYEKDMYKLKNDKQAMEQEAYLWSVADM
ncbi:BUD13 homolog [Lolium rigidum]|uniref:BUD13 homolog n=1 Tax=Lolium rigidum TaxID=89674 RepID=UPI001F5C3421|nr:BUD13 homolog [Lolium rigidum]